MFELCRLRDNKICGFAGYDHKKELRCGFATYPNHIQYMQKCPLSVKKRSRKR